VSCKGLLSTGPAEASGATTIRYGIVASMIAAVISAAVTVVGAKLTTTFNEVLAPN
jgi:Flp pilus assembly pilin Flp